MMNNQHATWRLRELAYFEQNKAEEWEKHATSLVPPCGYSHRACAKAADTCRFTSAAFLAGAEALERAVWRPISEAHEDFGSIVVIDMADPGNHDIAHVCGRDWEEKTQGMTHFAQLPLLTEEIARAALARLEGK
jgi:hypothetical protein